MQTYENQTWDNEKLQTVEQNVNQRLDAVEHKITEVIKSIESQLGKHHKSLSDAIAEQPTNTSKTSSTPSQISDDTVVSVPYRMCILSYTRIGRPVHVWNIPYLYG